MLCTRIKIALRSVCASSARILKRTHTNIEATCADLNAMHMDQIALKSVRTISTRILKRICTDIIMMPIDRTVEELFRFKFEGRFILLIKDKMDIL